MEQSDYYILLGLQSSASPEELKKAFHRKALEHHPDRNPGDNGAAARFRQVSEAYRVLSDPATRAAYDRSRSGMDFGNALPIVEYLYAEIDTNRVCLNEEVELMYRFPGEGRFFRKPQLQGWIITAGPTVSHRQHLFEGRPVRETVLHYTICPLAEGSLSIPGASISFHRHPVYSAPLKVEVQPAECYFRKGEKAGTHPCLIRMHRLQTSNAGAWRKTRVMPRVVVIPRSDLAAWYHKTARMLKVSLTLIGGAWALLEDESVLMGLMGGSLLAGINIQVMYRLMGIKSLFYCSRRYPLVKEYEAMGYEPGSYPDESHFGNRTVLWIKSLLF